MALNRLSSNQGATVRKRWTGLATSVTMVASLLALHGTIGAKAAEPTWTLFAAGDIAKCDAPGDEATAALVERRLGDPD